MNPASLSALLDSLPKPEKGQAEETQYRLLTPADKWREGDDMLVFWHDDATQEIQIQWKPSQEILHGKVIQSSIARRAESLRVPEGLRESIKKAVLAGMDAEQDFICKNFDTSEAGKIALVEPYRIREELRALCAPDSPPSGK